MAQLEVGFKTEGAHVTHPSLYAGIFNAFF
ncbi:uncharacterized protein G2W53_020811 [Senna tora]|uniref:Uncharacterized protein n=1 Tax=Senna tora TaxID=362788 RepID=A0A834WHA0_9FABA|nr:uncharacterized protein G2W53_020811 [Senna tora]